jgi:phage host-nuclease inhibitor protein Gam
LACIFHHTRTARYLFIQKRYTMKKLMTEQKSILNTIFTVLLMTLLVLGTGSCKQGSGEKEAATKEDVKEEVQEAMKTSKDYASEKKEELVENYRERMDKVQGQIDSLKQEMNDASASAKQEYREKINSLESRHAELQNKVDEFKNASGEAWKDLKEGVDNAFSDIEDAVKEAKSELKK